MDCLVEPVLVIVLVGFIVAGIVVLHGEFTSVRKRQGQEED